MVPIHDTDVAEERWTKSEWENYELWEKIELREKRKRRLWILATVFLFLVLSAVPIVVEQLPKWVARSLTRQLAQKVNQMKRDSSIARTPFRLRILVGDKLQYAIEKVTDCGAEKGEAIGTGTLEYRSFEGHYVWVTPAAGETLRVPGLIGQFCYDPLLGNDTLLKGKPIAGFGIISVKDLAEKRLDRMALLLLTGPSAEISFD